MNTEPEISVVIPVFNEEENISVLAEELTAALTPLKKDFEVIFVNDGSTDDTLARIHKTSESNPAIKSIDQPKRSGQSSAMLAGLEAAQGSIIVTIDGDLQNDPTDIPAMLEKLSSCDCVCGYRKNRKDTWSRRVGSKLANRIRNMVTKDGIIDTGCSLKAFKKDCISHLPPLRGVHRFMPAYFKLHGRKIEQMPVNHRPRKHGTTKYTNLSRLPTTIRDLSGFRWYAKRLIRAAKH